ncbi:MAG: hypothetical protein AB8G99_18480 [Planctomycetaceae bacterium]
MTVSQKTQPHRRVLFVVAYVVFIAILIAIAARVVLMVRTNQSLDGSMEEIDIWTFYYPELEHSKALHDVDDHKHFDVLFLGGSVLEQVAKKLKPRDFAAKAGSKQVRLYNLAKSAHTSLDSLLKMRQLSHRDFDVVVIYHGINDARMNCCKPEHFRSDYSHCKWYQSMEQRLAEKRITLTDIVTDVKDQVIGLGQPKPELSAEGLVIKTADAFESNIREITRLAAESAQTQTILGTFAFHLPKGYSREKMEAGELGYANGDYEMVAESWGEPDGVREAVRVHNNGVRTVAESSLQIDFLDIDARLSGDIQMFCDLCHVSDAGRIRFQSLLLEAIEVMRREPTK